jgi:hypothetical protein
VAGDHGQMAGVDQLRATHSSSPPLLLPELGVAALLAAVLLIHTTSAPAREYLSFDDPTNFVDNLRVQSWSWAHLRWIVTDGVLLGVWEPVSLVFRLACWTSMGGSAEATHRVSIGLHAATACAAFLVAGRRWAPVPVPVPAATGPMAGHPPRMFVWWLCCWLSTLLVLGLHPTRVEVVHWASAQGYLLATLLALGCLAAHPPPHDADGVHSVVAGATVQGGQAAGQQRAPPAGEGDTAKADTATSTSPCSAGGRWRVVSLACYAAAVCSKPAALPLPALLVCADALCVLCPSGAASASLRDEGQASMGRPPVGSRLLGVVVRANWPAAVIAALLGLLAVRADAIQGVRHVRASGSGHRTACLVAR